MPVLAGDCGGVSGIVADGKTGWLVPVGDIDAFAGKLAECLASDRYSALRDMGQFASQKAEPMHTITAAAKAFILPCYGMALPRGMQKDVFRAKAIFLCFPKLLTNIAAFSCPKNGVLFHGGSVR